MAEVISAFRQGMEFAVDHDALPRILLIMQKSYLIRRFFAHE